MDVFGLCDIYSCAVGDTVYIRKVTQIFAGIHPCKFRKFPVSGFYIIRDRRTALRGFTGFGFCQRVNPPTTEVMGFPPLLWVAAF